MQTRLEVIASLVDAGSRLIDIGSDHAMLPLLLLERRIVERIGVSDIAEGPLNNAKRTLAGKNADFYLADGLPSTGEFDSAVIAGMGGHTIIDILRKDRVRFQQMRYLILQPMQHLMQLREYLLENGYRLIKERLTHEDHFYVILKVSAGEDTPYDLLLGRDFSEDASLYREYLHHHKRRICSFYSGLSGEKKEKMRDLLTRIEDRLQDMV
ncbi:MAG: SAM-dependent methyltransferase [Tissierellia bacterium]|nr:SAM-dependent methyltransferase [Tissierellia bacterium]